MTTGIPVIGFMPYDEAMKKFFTLNFYSDPSAKTQGIIVEPVTGPPRLDYSLQDTLDEFNVKDENKRLNQTVKLPAMALSRLDWTFDASRWTYSLIRDLGRTEDGKRVIQSMAPFPFNVLYQLDIWTKYRAHMNQFIRTVMLKFLRRETALNVDIGGPWGIKRILLSYISGPSDLTKIDPGLEDRDIRNVFRFMLNAWIIPDPFTIPTVLKIVNEMYIGNVGTPYPTTIDFVGWDKAFEIPPSIEPEDILKNP